LFRDVSHFIMKFVIEDVVGFLTDSIGILL
jgi:hypothetical protein